MIAIGTMLYGFCGGYFGNNVYEDKRVEAIGFDWVVARGVGSGVPYFAKSPENLGIQAELSLYRLPEKDK